MFVNAAEVNFWDEVVDSVKKHIDNKTLLEQLFLESAVVTLDISNCFPYTVIEVNLTTDQYRLRGIGVSKKNPKDRMNWKIACKIAAYRAIFDMHNRFFVLTNGKEPEIVLETKVLLPVN